MDIKELIKEEIKQLKSKIDVEEITRVSITNGCLKIYYTVTDSFKNTNHLSAKNYIYHMNLSNYEYIYIIDSDKIDMKEVD